MGKIEDSGFRGLGSLGLRDWGMFGVWGRLRIGNEGKEEEAAEEGLVVGEEHLLLEEAVELGIVTRDRTPHVAGHRRSKLLLRTRNLKNSVHLKRRPHQIYYALASFSYSSLE